MSLSAWAERKGQSIRLSKTGLPSDMCSLPEHVSKDFALLAQQFAQLLGQTVIPSLAFGEMWRTPAGKINVCSPVRKCASWLNSPDLSWALISVLISWL